MVKCIVWDLDNTIWDGTLDANDDIKLNNNVIEYIKDAFEKGIVLAVASKNNYKQAYEKIIELGIKQYFYKLYISWNDKYKAIKDLAKRLNISVEHILFVDDSDMELSEALYHIPELQILNVKDIALLNNYLDNSIILTEESKNRNTIYKILEKRKKEEKQMSKEEFLKYCNIQIDINIAEEKDFCRINELLARTNQMNLNNKLLSIDELKNISKNKDWTIFSVRMVDIFADYGIVGTVITREKENIIEIEYLAISCKVEGRNIGRKVVEFIKKIARKNNKNIMAKYFYNLKNEKLKALFVLSGFTLDKNNCYFYRSRQDRVKLQIDKKLDNETKFKIKRIVSEIGKKDYSDDFCIMNEFDSLMFIRLVVTIEKEFSIPIDVSKINIQNFDTIKKIAKFVEENINEDLSCGNKEN